MSKIKLTLILVLALNLSCNNSNNKRTVIDFKETSVKNNTENNIDKPKAIYIAIASMTSPKETYKYYSELVSYISDKVGYPIYIKQKKTYEEVNLLLKNGEVDFAFICSGAFVENHKNVKLLVAPEINKETSYQAYIIAQKDSDVEDFKDFKNNSFAFTDPLSNTGRLFPLKKMMEMKSSEDEFFKKTIFTYGHDKSIEMVNHGIIDGASINGLIFDYLSLFNPEKVINIKIVEKSEDFGVPPIVAPINLSKKRFDKYQNVFLNLQNDSIGNSILQKINIDKYVVVDKRIYESVFQLKSYVGNEASK
jgi:phosphonate transport system substrate-binding protein